MEPTWEETEDVATAAPAVDASAPPSFDETAEIEEPKAPGLLERIGEGAKQAFNDTVGNIEFHGFDTELAPSERARISSPGGVGVATDLMMQGTAGPAMGKALSPVGQYISKKLAPAVPQAAKVLDTGMASTGGILDAAPVIEQAAPATKPFLTKLADVTDVTSHAKNFVGKAASIFEKLGGEMSPGAKKAANIASDISGRAGVYFAPGPLKYAQGVSDTARGAQKAKSAVETLMQKAPERLGKYAPMLQQAAQRGGSALATTDFMLQKTDPEYQAILKKAQDQ